MSAPGGKIARYQPATLHRRVVDFNALTARYGLLNGYQPVAGAIAALAQVTAEQWRAYWHSTALLAMRLMPSNEEPRMLPAPSPEIGIGNVAETLKIGR